MHYLEFHRYILAAVLAMARIEGAFLICPVFTDSMIPGIARRVINLAFAFLLLPVIMADMPPGEPNYWAFAILALKEVLIGFLIGFFGAIPFWIAENVGNVIDNQRGATMGEVYSPLSGEQVSTLGIFFTQIVSVIFFVGGAVFIFLGAIYTSYRIWPVFDIALQFQADTPQVFLGSIDAMLQTTVIIAAPVVILMFLATIGLGFVNRTAPQLNVFFLSMPVKSALGIAMLVIYIPFIMDILMYTKEESILGTIRRLIGA